MVSGLKGVVMTLRESTSNDRPLVASETGDAKRQRAKNVTAVATRIENEKDMTAAFGF